MIDFSGELTVCASMPTRLTDTTTACSVLPLMISGRSENSNGVEEPTRPPGCLPLAICVPLRRSATRWSLTPDSSSTKPVTRTRTFKSRMLAGKLGCLSKRRGKSSRRVAVPGVGGVSSVVKPLERTWLVRLGDASLVSSRRLKYVAPWTIVTLRHTTCGSAPRSAVTCSASGVPKGMASPATSVITSRNARAIAAERVVDPATSQ